jgi:hypothetical protein
MSVPSFEECRRTADRSAVVDTLNAAADLCESDGPDAVVPAAMAALFRKIAWLGRLDRDLLARVGCDEVVALAAAVLANGGAGR